MFVGNYAWIHIFFYRRRTRLPKCANRPNTSCPHNSVDRANAVHFPQHQRIRNGSAQGYRAFRPDAHGGHQSVRMAVRFGGGDEARDFPFESCPW